MPDPLFSLKTSLAGRYKIEREIGAGGMATVYRAQDLRHDRPVAVKVLRADLAAVIGAERFLAEIKTTANLQHAHILGLIDSGEADGTVFYVMPFVEGESLRAKLVREKQIPIPEAVRIASAIAGALDYAHRRGVIHRDIKPENILLHEGQPLVADFGIALAMTRSGGAPPGSGSRMTESGMSLGTPQYMSPEQAAGERNLDARTDIYALGCVLYEMLTGEPPFSGPTAQAIIAKVMTVEPEPVTTLRRSVPANVAAATMTALNKVPADRFATAAEFAAALADPRYVSPEVAARRAASRFTNFTPRSVAAVSAILVLGIASIVGWMRHAPSATGVVARFEIQYDATTFANSVHLSPDGSQLIWAAGGAYWSRRFDTLGVKRLRDAAAPQAGIRAISPDGRDVLLSGGGRLSIASLTSGPAREIAAVGGRGGATWASDGHIYFAFGAPDDPKRGIARVAASGGVVDTVATISDGSLIGEIVPLPGGHGLVVVRNYRTGSDSLTTVNVSSGKWATLTAIPGNLAGGGGGPGGPGGGGGAAAQVQYVAPGYLLFANTQYIMAAPFDAQRLVFTQPPAPFIEVANGVSSLAANANVLVYRVAPDPQGDVGIELRPLNGAPRSLPNVAEGIQFGGFSVSSDGKRLVATGTPAVTAGATQPVANLYVYQLPIGPMQRFRSDDRETSASWIPDTRNLAFVRYESRDSVVRVPGPDTTKRDTIPIEVSTLMRRPWDGTAAPESILAERGGRDTLLGPSSWLSSTRAIVQVGGVRGANGGGRGRGGPARGGARGGAPVQGAGGRGGGPGQVPGGDLMLLTVGKPSTMRPFIKTDAPETNPVASPNGRLLAYQSNVSGNGTEVYVSPIDGSARVQVSLNGGTTPRWSASGNVLFFRVAGAGGGADTLYSARILGTADPSVADIKPVLVGASLVGGYAPLPGDSLFIMRPAAADTHRPFIVVLNFAQELDRLFQQK